MANSINLKWITTLIKDLGTQSRRCIAQEIEKEFTFESFSEGELLIEAGVTDVLLTGEFDILFAMASSPFEVKVGDIANTAITTKLFSFENIATATIFYFGNPNLIDMKIQYVAAKSA